MDHSGTDFLGKTGRPWAQWPEIGDVVEGVIVEEPSARQSRDYESGELMAWPNGDPKMEVLIAVDTGKTDPEIENDDGERLIVLPVSSARFRAVQAAMRVAQVKGVHAGDTLWLKYIGDGPRVGKKNPPKQYLGKVTPAPAQSEKAAMSALSQLGTLREPQQSEVPF